MGKYLEKLQAGRLKSEQWLCYKDSNGLGYAQPDHFIILPKHILLIECKLTQRNHAFTQMGALYAPLLRHLYSLPVVGVQACRNLHTVPERYLVEEIEEELDYRGIEDLLTWHAFGV